MKVNLRVTVASAMRTVLFIVVFAELQLFLAPSAFAVPSYARRYGEQCSTCHSMWGALTPAGLTFKLSGYRAIFGKDLTPVTPDQKISKNVSLPATLPLSFVTGVGFDSRSETRNNSGANSTSSGSSIALEDASIFMTSPLGDHLTAFVEFPMYESRAWEFTPTGNYEARFNVPGRQIQFRTESPIFEVAKFFWNNPFGDALPRDSVNFLAGITQLPLAYPSGKVRIAVNQYLIYERTALDLISPRSVTTLTGADVEPNDVFFRMSEAQGLGEVYGMTTFGKPVTDVGDKNTVWAEYHFGLSNGSNAKASYHSQKDVYGRLVMRYYGQSLGLFALSGIDSYNDDLRNQASLAIGPQTGIMSGAQNPNKLSRFGPDVTISFVPFGIPVWIENQYMINSDGNPTGFGKEFKWRGGFDQVNWKMSKNTLAYLRYDYVKGDAYDDTTTTVNGVTGITRSTPKENDVIVGVQHLLDENTKFIAEYRTHTFDDTATGAAIAGLAPSSANAAHLKDTGFTVRMMFGF